MDSSIWMLALIALPVGVMQGFFGSGGGLILVPALLWVSSNVGIETYVAAHVAIGTSLLAILASSLLNTWMHHKRSAVRWDILKEIMPGVVLGAIAGSCIAAMSSYSWLLIAVALHALLAGLYIVFTAANEEQNKFSVGVTNLISFFIGVVSSVVGIGGATLTVPYLLHRGVCALESVATSAAVGIPITFLAAISYGLFGFNSAGLPSMSLGYLWLPAAGVLVVGTMLTNKIGVKLAHKISKSVIRTSYGMYSIVVGSFMLIKIVV